MLIAFVKFGQQVTKPTQLVAGASQRKQIYQAIRNRGYTNVPRWGTRSRSVSEGEG
ncbi:MAG: hypothetical protein V7K86_12960 [Nostoc sp.]|uniref:hypothetical protein n=1 Tax=Nostoc sp. TaxID=1180 RepID=UPI002FF49E2A